MQTYSEELLADVPGMYIFDAPATWHLAIHSGFYGIVTDNKIVDAPDLYTYLLEHCDLMDYYEHEDTDRETCGWVKMSDTVYEYRSECEVETYTFTRLDRIEDELILMLKIEGLVPERDGVSVD